MAEKRKKNEEKKSSITRIREAKKSGSKTLDLRSLNLSSLPDELWELSHLENLSLGFNNLNSISPKIGLLTNLKKLELVYNKLTSLPEEIGGLSELQVLILGSNEITDLPRSLQYLKKLVWLDIRSNQLKIFPREIGLLTNLEKLWCGASLYGHQWKTKDNIEKHNSFSEIPPEIGNLENLDELDFYGSPIKSIPIELKKIKRLKKLDLRETSLEIPAEILGKYNKPSQIIDYYFRYIKSNKKKLNATKMLIIGQGSVGKTSLINRIVNNKFDDRETKTEGIAINYWLVNSESQSAKIQLNIWDFGGQEIMHATHQFFLTKRSLYLLVLDSRLTQEENRVEYWLKIIQSFGGESPVLIVGNKIDQHPLDIDRTGLQKKYPNIVGILETSAATGTGIEELKTAITEQVNNLPHVRDLLPETWFTVKTKLEELGKQSNFITHDKYLDLCAENEVSDETSQRTLIGFLHDLGVVLHFQDDPRLEALGILNPQWVTNGVYKILNSHTLFQNKGMLTVSMLDEILNLPEYPRGKRLFIVDMMKKFELCYDIESDKTFLVPDLLPKDQPDLKFNGVPAFEYAYPVLPSSVITRFIVRMNQKIDDGFVWRTGVVLKIGENKALVKADIEDRKITIAIDGLEHTRRDALSAIRFQLDEIHASIKGLNPQKMVPIPNAPNAEPLKYEYLLMLETKGMEILPVQDGDRLVEVNVRQVLSGVESESQRRQNAGNIYNIVGDINVREGDFIGGNKRISAGDRSVIVDGNVSGNLISGNYNKINSAEIDSELKDTLLQLGQAVEAIDLL